MWYTLGVYNFTTRNILMRQKLNNKIVMPVNRVIVNLRCFAH